MNKKSFTLLEVIIVIIIIGALASLALPRLFSVVEKSKAAEALSAIAAIRSSLERYYLWQGTYRGVNQFDNLDIENPGNSPNAYFFYAIRIGESTTDGEVYTIYAYRNPPDAGLDVKSYIVYTNLTTRGGPGTPFICGVGLFDTVGIGECPGFYQFILNPFRE